jgi:glucosamine--fructose-6-phosphate aminotransferase (isomerizing)
MAMNTTEPYGSYSLVKEMLETPSVVRGFPADRAGELAPRSSGAFLTGEGSSRIFPAKHARLQALRRGDANVPVLEGGEQASEYRFGGMHLYAASNSGRTAEVVRLLTGLKSRSADAPERTTAVVAFPDRPIGELCDEEFVLTCGPEEAVAATKSVVEQALFYDCAFRTAAGIPLPSLQNLGDALESVLTASVDPAIVKECLRGGRIYFSGRNDGVAEELTLKTNEITRRASAYLEGTYAVHGVEEVMNPEDTVVVIDPFESEEEKLERVLIDGVGLSIVAIASRNTRFPTIRIPELPDGSAYAQLLAGWNLLVEIGIAAGVNLDKPERARKIGNEFTG